MARGGRVGAARPPHGGAHRVRHPRPEGRAVAVPARGGRRPTAAAVALAATLAVAATLALVSSCAAAADVAADVNGTFASSKGPLPIGPVPEHAGLGADAAALVGERVVRIDVVSCVRRHHGTGFFVAPDLVLTAAHVVAGAADIEVLDSAGGHLGWTGAGSRPGLAPHDDLRVVAWDSARDLALLQVGYGVPTHFERADGEPGDVVAVAGYRFGKELAVRAARLEHRVSARSADIYREGETLRDVYLLAAEIGSGNSGGPLVDEAGRAVGVVVAVAGTRFAAAVAVSDTEVRQFLAEAADAIALGRYAADADTGRCLNQGGIRPR
ncbi:MAG TPA: hypothetical protein DEP69_00840 [Acidimicrobiaceae bacterium]|nr:hypothetical protein [Acidimicrobiaceae bacterium]